MAPYRIYPVSAEGSYGVATFIITGGQLRSYGVANFNHIRWPIWIGIRSIKDGEVFMRSASNNCYPHDFDEWKCDSLTKILREQTKPLTLRF